jgi:hypothetical protein
LTLLWFVVWLIWDLVGDREPIEFTPVNFWAGWLLLALALDLSRQHATGLAKR